MILLESLVPPELRTEGLHVLMVGGWIFVCGVASVGITALAARFVRGRDSGVFWADVATALFIVGLIAGWMVAVQLWATYRFGSFDLDAVPVASLWPLVALIAVIQLLLLRRAGTYGWRAGVAVAAIALALLSLDTALSVVGALEDGSISTPGLVVGAIAVAALCSLIGWMLILVRGRRRSMGTNLHS